MKDPSEGRPGHFPALAAREWITFGALAAGLAVTNVYTTLLTGWGDGGSLIAVVAAVMVLRAAGARVHIQALNLGQTMASAGGMVGFALAAYAAVRIVMPGFQPDPALLLLLVVGTSVVGVVVAVIVRPQMLGYYFPSGTACAVIQRTVTDPEHAAGTRRSLRLLAGAGALAAAWTLPVKIALEQGKGALLSRIPLPALKGQPLGISLEPFLFGIGLVVGPRVGLGMLLGALVPPLVLMPSLPAAEHPHAMDWALWCAIAALTAPTFAMMAFAYLFRAPPVVPPGFTPGRAVHPVPGRRARVWGALAVAGLAATAAAARLQFGLAPHVALLGVALCVPLVIMNGRVTGDTDINPVVLAVFVLFSVFAVAGLGDVPALLCVMLIVSVVGAIAVDTMQDYRTGYLVDANPAHQATVQVIGVVIGAVAAVPLILLLDAQFGFGDGPGQLPAPGPQIYVGFIQALTGTAHLPPALLLTIAAISVAGCAYAFFAVWPPTARWMPSLFGAGIGLLIGVDMSAAIFVGGVARSAVTLVAARGKRGRDRDRAVERAEGHAMIAGSATFAAGAITAVVLIALSRLTGWFHVAM